ncbi:unnamed protein product [Sphagnum balticum]
MRTVELPDEDSEGVRESNLMRRLFLAFAAVSDNHRFYYEFIDEEGMRKLLERFLIAHKTKLILKIMFNAHPDKIIGKKLLPIKTIPGLFREYGMTEKEVAVPRIFYNYGWMQHYNAGITFEQFYLGSIALGMNGNGDNWRGIYDLIRKFVERPLTKRLK